MGSRGNVYITDSSLEGYNAPEFQGGARGIYVYSHWDGHALPSMVQQAVRAGRDRWTDDTYFTRILIDQLIASGRDASHGFGIGLTIGDNSFPITIVDIGAQEVAWAQAGDERDRSKWQLRTKFSDYVNLPDAAVGYPSSLR